MIRDAALALGVGTLTGLAAGLIGVYLWMSCRDGHPFGY